MKKIKIDGYIGQRKLHHALKSIVGDENWVGGEVRVSEFGRYRWDIVYKSNAGIVAVEFDGDSHYRDPNVIFRDRLKEKSANELGYKVIRLPYWVQLTTQTLRYYFDLEAEVEQDFLHGFITTKFFPASFCPMGLERFRKDFAFLPDDIKRAVAYSIIKKAVDIGMEYCIDPFTFETILPYTPKKDL